MKNEPEIQRKATHRGYRTAKPKPPKPVKVKKAKPKVYDSEVVERSAPLELARTKAPIDKVSAANIEKANRAEQLLTDVYIEALETCQDSLATFDIDPQDLVDGKPPDHWRSELGGDEIAIQRRLRVAMASRLPTKEAPMALQTAQAVVQNVVRMQAKSSAALMNVKQLNVAVIVGGTKHEYPSMEITAGAERDED